MSETKLPEYFVIKCDKSNPLWTDYINWCNNKGADFEGKMTDHYYGYDGSWAIGLRTLFKGYTILTLAEWDAAVNGANYEVKFIADKPTDTTALKLAIEKWGIDRQIDKIIEETSEINIALMKLRHAEKDGLSQVDCLQNLISEHADVLNTLELLDEIYGAGYSQKVSEARAFKKQRLLNKLNQ